MKAIEWLGDGIRILDQRKLPLEVRFLHCTDVESLAEAIKTLAVRGAPLLGVAAAMGIALAARRSRAAARDELLEELEAAAVVLRAARPTAVNLFWGVDRLLLVAQCTPGGPQALRSRLEEEALAIHAEDEALCARIGAHGAELIGDGDTVLTHCNTGALATGGIGTAFGVIRTAWESGKRIHVLADETRPLLQGARLTTFELQSAGIPYTLITDSMAGHFMQLGRVQLAIVGADRIAANGDTANKIGTYSIAVLARHHRIPFYVAAPTSTVDAATPSGAHIVIEERPAHEVTRVGECQVAPHDAPAANPAFDVTPHELISGIITEYGVARPPFQASLRQALEAAVPPSGTPYPKWGERVSPPASFGEAGGGLPPSSGQPTGVDRPNSLSTLAAVPPSGTPQCF